MLGGNPAMDYYPIHKGVEKLLVTSCYIETGDKRWPDGPLGLYADFTFTVYVRALMAYQTIAYL